jgi:hypothetical protein
LASQDSLGSPFSNWLRKIDEAGMERKAFSRMQPTPIMSRRSTGLGKATISVKDRSNSPQCVTYYDTKVQDSAMTPPAQKNLNMPQ